MAPVSLEIQLFSGDFESYGQAMTITSPQKVTFRWIPKLEGITSVVWRVAASPFNNGATPAILLQGSAGTVPKVGHLNLFVIDFAKIVSQTPPAQPKKYYVGLTAGGTAANMAMPQTTITYVKPGPGVVFTKEGLGLTTKQKHAGMYAASPMQVVLDLKQLYVGNDNESSGDEPYLFVAVVYADGTTINPLALSTSTVRVDCPIGTHGNVPDEDKSGEDLDDGKTANIPSATGHFEKAIKPIGLELAADMEDADGKIGQAMMDGTAVYLLVVGMEEDATETAAANAARGAALAELKKKANGAIQKMTLADLSAGKTPKFDPREIQKELKEKALAAAKDETMIPGWWTPALAPLFLDDIADPDDYVGWGMRRFTFGELLAAGTKGIDFELSLSSSTNWEGSYTVKGNIHHK